MAVLFAEDVQTPDAPVNVPTTEETLVVASFPISWASGNGKAVIRGWCDLLVGAEATAVTLTIHAGPTITGRIVGQRTPDAGGFTPGQVSTFEVECVDVLENAGGAQYCLSVEQTGATDDGIVRAALIDTTILSG